MRESLRGVFWICVVHGVLSGLLLLFLAISGAELQHPVGILFSGLLTSPAVELAVGVALIIMSLALVVPSRKVFWSAFGVNFVASLIYLAPALELGANLALGMGVLVVVPIAFFWYLTQFSYLNRLRKGLWPSRSTR
jgi:hypothetical protein